MRTPYPNETFSRVDREHLAPADASVFVQWNDPSLKRITCLRLLTDPGFPLWDVSYVWGELNDGRHVYVHLPFSQLGRKTWWSEIKDYAKNDGVNLSKLRVWDSVSKLW